MSEQMKDAFKKAGYDPGLLELHTMCRAVLGKDKHGVLRRHVTALVNNLRAIAAAAPALALFDSEDELRRRCERILRVVYRDMHGGEAHKLPGNHVYRGLAKSGGAHSAVDSQNISGPTEGAAQATADGQTALGRPINIAVQKAVAEKAAKLSIMDTLLIRDGRPIGKVRFGELERLRSDNLQEASLFRQIQNHCGVVSDHTTLIRDLVTDQDLQRMWQRAAEVADAA